MTLRYARKTPETHPLVAGRDYLLRISEKPVRASAQWDHPGWHLLGMRVNPP
jgi:hypothetical protein